LSDSQQFPGARRKTENPAGFFADRKTLTRAARRLIPIPSHRRATDFHLTEKTIERLKRRCRVAFHFHRPAGAVFNGALLALAFFTLD